MLIVVSGDSWDIRMFFIMEEWVHTAGLIRRAEKPA